MLHTANPFSFSFSLFFFCGEAHCCVALLRPAVLCADRAWAFAGDGIRFQTYILRKLSMGVAFFPREEH